ncbi:MAG TPA: ABC transporter ATP-binding protein [Ktedonobacteraceae bacterium]|nr:ABC transporter ATP-binding protein [Ktedonobacteraceae bacterium]
MGFVMDGLDAENYDRTYSDRVLIKRIGRYFGPRVKLTVLVSVLVIMGSLVDVILPLLLANGLDTLSSTNAFSSAVWLIGAIVVAGCLSWVFGFFRQWYTAKVVSDVVMRLQRDAFDAILDRDMSFYDEYSSGKIVSRVTSDTEDFSKVMTLSLSLVSQVLLFFLIAVLLFFRSVPLALIALSISPVIIAIALLFRKIAREITRRSQRSMARVNANVQEAITGITVAKNFRQEQHMYDEFKSINAQAYQVNLRTGFTYNGIFPILVTVANLGTTAIIYFGGLSALNHSISAGDWFLFVQSLRLFWFPLTSIASFWSQFQLGLSASERVFALLDAEPRVKQHAQESVPTVRGEIDFKHLFFSYTDQQTVLKDFTLHVPVGETIALVGHTGAGKSSIAKLVARFYEFQGGELLIDGRDIRSLDLRDYRRRLGVVPQTPFLFSGTVADNIRYAHPDATEEDILAAARQIGHGDWLDALPDGLATQVGESGHSLSMGQRQLVALTRVLIQNPSIIILDEATASVDPLTEAQIQEGLDMLLKDRTSILIAHRLSTIQHADRIIVLDRGQIVEEGNHRTLMQSGGHYAQLYNTYFRHQSPDYRPGEGFVPVNLPIEPSLAETAGRHKE